MEACLSGCLPCVTEDGLEAGQDPIVDEAKTDWPFDLTGTNQRLSYPTPVQTSPHTRLLNVLAASPVDPATKWQGWSGLVCLGPCCLENNNAQALARGPMTPPQVQRQEGRNPTKMA